MLAVLHEGRLIGRIDRSGAALAFTYDASWIAQPRAFPLSPRLPLREAPWQNDEVAFFFANLMPEGPVLDGLLQLRRLPRGNLYRILEAFGRECAGAFEIVAEEGLPAGTAEDSYREYPREVLRQDLARLRDHIPLLASHSELRLSLAGAQNKIPVRWMEGRLYLPEGNAASTHILKPALQLERLLPDSVANEAFCLRLAGALGIPVPHVEVLRDPEPVLLVERYDRIVSEGAVSRLHQLDFCQLAGVLPSQKYEADGGPGYAACFALLDAHSAAPAVDRLRFVDWLLFNYLVGNADAHAKNVSMLHGAEGSLRLAPAYDLLATGYWPQIGDRMAMGIGREKRPSFVHARHWQGLAEALGLNLTQLRRRALDLARRALKRQGDIAAEVEASVALRQHIQMTLAERGEWFDRRLGVVPDQP